MDLYCHPREEDGRLQETGHYEIGDETTDAQARTMAMELVEMLTGKSSGVEHDR